MNKLIIENRTDLPMSEIMLYAAHIVSMGYISNNDTQLCYASTWPNGIVAVSDKNKKSDRLVFYYDKNIDKGAK